MFQPAHLARLRHDACGKSFFNQSVFLISDYVCGCFAWFPSVSILLSDDPCGYFAEKWFVNQSVLVSDDACDQQVNMCLTSTETIKLIRDGEKGMEVGEEGDYIPIATLSPPE